MRYEVVYNNGSWQIWKVMYGPGATSGAGHPLTEEEARAACEKLNK